MSDKISGNPYYDDFSEDKNFLQILFKPGFAVQARELTQLQTILKNQIKRFGSHVFEEGSIVHNGNTELDKKPYFKIQKPLEIVPFAGETILGLDSEATATIVGYEANEDGYFVWINPTNGKNFTTTENLKMVTSNTTLSLVTDEYPFDYGYVYSIDESIFFIKGSFVYIEAQNLFIYERNLFKRLGIEYEEKIINSNMDSTLLDPAQGSYNYSAPGADRYSIELKLASRSYDEFSSEVINHSNDNFFTITIVNNNDVQNVVYLPKYNDLENVLAKRTYDESGDYTVSPFICSVKNPTSSPNDNSGELLLRIGPGNCYVKGYNFERTGYSNRILKKARDTELKSGEPVYYGFGNYIFVENVSGNPDLFVKRQIRFKNIGGDIIGTAFITDLQYDSTDIYKMYIVGVNFVDGHSITEVHSVDNTATPPFYAEVAASKYVGLGEISILKSFEDAAFIETPNKFVQTFLIDGVSDTQFDAKKLFQTTFIGDGSLTTAPINNPTPNQNFVGVGTELNEDITNRDFLVSVSSNTGTGPVAGTVLTYSAGLRIFIDSSQQITLTYNNATNFGTGGGNLVNVFAKVSCSNWLHKTKTKTTTTFVHNTPSDEIIFLNYADGIKLLSIVGTTELATTEDVTSSFIFKGGQTDEYYGLSYIERTEDISTFVSLNITYEYFHHSSNYGFFTVDSYTDTGISYEKVPSYTSTKGKTYNLTDVIDFRPTMNSQTTFSGDLIPILFDDYLFDYTFYLPRKDRLVVSKDGLEIIEGKSAIDPFYPPEPSNSMTLYLIDLDPYTKTIGNVSLNYIDNRRFTMRDIGKIDKKIKRLEYYSSLNLLENRVSNVDIDSAGLQRFRAGFVVDPFNDHSIGDTNNQDYNCSIDKENRILGPKFNSRTLNFKLDSHDSNVIQKQNIIMNKYTEMDVIKNSLHSKYIGVNPNEVIEWVGNLSLIPSSISTQTLPVLSINVTKNPDGVYSSTNGAIWNEWQSKITGIITDETQTVVSENTSTIITQFNNKLLFSDTISYVPSRSIQFVAEGLNPLTHVYVSTNNGYIFSNATQYTQYKFDSSVPVNSVRMVEGSNSAKIIKVTENSIFVFGEVGLFLEDYTVNFYDSSNTLLSTKTIVEKVESRSGSTGNLTTNEYGAIAGEFFIRENTLPSGNHIIRVSNALYGIGSSIATNNFSAMGLIEQKTNITLTTIKPIITEPPPSPPNTGTGGTGNDGPAPVDGDTSTEEVPTTGSSWLGDIVGDNITWQPKIILSGNTLFLDELRTDGIIDINNILLPNGFEILPNQSTKGFEKIYINSANKVAVKYNLRFRTPIDISWININSLNPNLAYPFTLHFSGIMSGWPSDNVPLLYTYVISTINPVRVIKTINLSNKQTSTEIISLRPSEFSNISITLEITAQRNTILPTQDSVEPYWIERENALNLNTNNTQRAAFSSFSNSSISGGALLKTLLYTQWPVNNGPTSVINFEGEEEVIVVPPPPPPGPNNGETPDITFNKINGIEEPWSPAHYGIDKIGDSSGVLYQYTPWKSDGTSLVNQREKIDSGVTREMINYIPPLYNSMFTTWTNLNNMGLAAQGLTLHELNPLGNDVKILVPYSTVGAKIRIELKWQEFSNWTGTNGLGNFFTFFSKVYEHPTNNEIWCTVPRMVIPINWTYTHSPPEMYGSFRWIKKSVMTATITNMNTIQYGSRQYTIGQFNFYFDENSVVYNIY